MGELAQLSGRPALVDSHALTKVEVIVIPPDRLRALLIAEAEVGERILRALILRRVGLLETGSGGPVIGGREGRGEGTPLGRKSVGVGRRVSVRVYIGGTLIFEKNN